MKIIVLGRSLPENNKNNIGIFEYAQAKILTKIFEVNYIFCDNQSIKVNKRFKLFTKKSDDLIITGIYLPIGGLYKPLFELIKYYCFIIIFKRITKKDIPEIIHVHYPLLTLNKRIIDFLNRKNIKIIVTEHWSKIAQEKLSNKEIEKLNYIYNNVCSFNVVSSLLKNSVLKYINKDSNNLNIVPNFVPNYFFELDDKVTNDNKKFRLVFVGRFTQTKNVEFLIKAMPNLIKLIPEIELNLYGNGIEKDNLMKLCKNLKLGNYVKFHGYIDNKNLPKELIKNDIYVSASKIETFGVPYIEAMAVGLPVVSPINGPLDELIQDNYGNLFYQNNINSFVVSIIKIYNSYPNIDRELIRSSIKSRYSESAIIEKLCIIYDDVLNINQSN